MELRNYLPSAKFTVMASSLALSVGLVLLAQWAVHPHTSSSTLSPSSSGVPADWQQSVSDVVADSGVEAPQPPDPATVATMLAQASTPNLTEEVGRSLIINLGSQSAQGLGQDAPTQDQLIAQAAAQINAGASSTIYTSSDLTIAASSAKAEHDYGNGVMSALLAHPEADARATYQALGAANDSGTSDSLSALAPIGQAYGDIAAELVALPVPQTLSPLHLKLANDFAAMAATYPDMQKLMTDPLRGMAAIQRYAALMDEATRVLTSIAETLNKDGILFNKDEPGNSLSGFLSS